MRHTGIVQAAVAALAVATMLVVPTQAMVILPNLPPGSQYQLAFVTHGTYSGTYSNIGAYNGFVTAEAALSTSLPQGVTWKAIASTITISARQNAPTYPSIPIYNTAGQRIADNGSTFWSGAESAFMEFDQNGDSVARGLWVWTGTYSNGTTFLPLGGSTPSYGWIGTAPEWCSGYSTFKSLLMPFFAISSVTNVLLPGDANGDGTVNGTDLNTVLSSYNLTGMTWSQGDFNGDGTVNGSDLNIVLSNYNQSAGATAAVPEPSTLVLLGMGAVVLVGYSCRRRKRTA
jgi:hypothetical protein